MTYCNVTEITFVADALSVFIVVLLSLNSLPSTFHLISNKHNEAPFEVAADEPTKEILQQALLATTNNPAMDPQVAAMSPWRRNVGIGFTIVIIIIIIAKFSIRTSSS